MRAVMHLFDAQMAYAAWADMWRHIKAGLMAGHRFEVEIRPERRTTQQNAKFHAICSDIARTKVPWAGKPRTAEQWKVLLVSGNSVATGQGSDIVPGLENEFVNIRESTALMSKARGSSLIEYAVAFCAMKGIECSEDETI